MMSILNNIKDKKQERLDSVVVTIDGVTVHVYGILHGITGGPNLDYVKAVNETIKSAPGVKYCEKSMKQMYDGLDFDVNDWMVFKPKEAFNFAFRSMIHPRFIYSLIKTSIAEKTTKSHRFGIHGIYSVNDVASSLKFHSVAPEIRRELCGFPSPEEYMKLNVFRREGTFNKRMRFADPDWIWLEYIEPNACIPLRSIHMIEYVVAHCKSKGQDTASLFVGEIHNSDVDWYVTNRDKLPEWLVDYASSIRKTAQRAAIEQSFVFKKKAAYHTCLFAGVSCAMLPYLAVILWVLSCR
ncbi:hypothetical protein BS054_19370 [Vibrio parahaemolyticus]|nr:hypothetical protein [Vibrio parahaemolyticus]